VQQRGEGGAGDGELVHRGGGFGADGHRIGWCGAGLLWSPAAATREIRNEGTQAQAGQK